MDNGKNLSRMMMTVFERDIRNLARTTAIVEKTGVMPEEEVNEYLNVMGKKYKTKYGGMSAEEILLDLKMENLIKKAIYDAIGDEDV